MKENILLIVLCVLFFAGLITLPFYVRLGATLICAGLSVCPMAVALDIKDEE